MEVKCECPRSSIVTVTSTCCDQLSSCTRSVETRPSSNSSASCRSNYTGTFYWQHPICMNSDKLARSIVYSNGEHPTNPDKSKEKNSHAPSESVMGSWRHPAAACLAPCINTRRLNRTYSEQKMRCLLTTTIAFCLGISVGALLPFLFPPVDVFPTSSSLSPNTQVKEPTFMSIKLESILSPQQPNAETFTLVDSEVTAQPPQEPMETQNISLRSPVSFVDISFKSTEGSSITESSVSEAAATPSGGNVHLTNGIYWSDWVERLLPKGFSEEDVANWRWQAWNSTVAHVESGCGRMQNRLITYENGKKACCRYRQNFDQIQGEIFSFYLSQLLGIKNLVPSTLDVIESKNSKWKSVREELQSAQWVDDRPIVLTQYVNNLSPAFIPALLRSSTRRVHPPDLLPSQLQFQSSLSAQVNSSASGGAFDEISELAQWSDLIVFDYLTANLDRMVNNLYNLQWNPTMMDAPAHNLAKDMSTGLLVFLDNESGLLHGYRLLDKYEHYHRLMLDSLCVFRKSTAEAIRRLRSYGSIQPLFKSMLSQFKRSQLLPMIPDKSIKVLNQRIDTVYRRIQKCKSLYINNTR